MTRSSPDSAIPSSSMKTAASSGSSSPSSISIRADSASTSAWLVGVARAAIGRDRRRGRRQVALADVEQDQHRLLGQEPEAADRLLLVRVEAQVADRRARLERRRGSGAGRPPRARSPRARRALPWRPLRLEPLEAPLGHRQVGEHELEVEPLEVARRVDAAVGVRARPGPRTRGRRGAAHRSRAAARGGRPAAPRSRRALRSRPAARAGRRR